MTKVSDVHTIATMPGQRPRELPAINLTHLKLLTDSRGIIRHTAQGEPKRPDGYNVDDNAAAFVLAASLEEMEEVREPARLPIETYARFLLQAFNPKTKRFHNLMGFDGDWLDQEGPEDSHGRALWALGTGVGRSPHRNFQVSCGRVLAHALPCAADFKSPRAWAYALLGIHEYLRILSGDEMVLQMRDTLASQLLELFVRSASSDWHWFEDILGRDSARLAHALIINGDAPGHKTLLDCGLHTLQWLVDVQTSEDGHFRPVGTNGFYRRGGPRAYYDQLPSEVYAMVSACLEAYRATSNFVWYERAQRAFDWFIGWNDQGLELYSAATGGCCDALQVDRVNTNQGTESTLAFLVALVEMRRAQRTVTVFNAPTGLSL